MQCFIKHGNYERCLLSSPCNSTALARQSVARVIIGAQLATRKFDKTCYTSGVLITPLTRTDFELYSFPRDYQREEKYPTRRPSYPPRVANSIRSAKFPPFCRRWNLARRDFHATPSFRAVAVFTSFKMFNRDRNRAFGEETLHPGVCRVAFTRCKRQLKRDLREIRYLF